MKRTLTLAGVSLLATLAITTPAEAGAQQLWAKTTPGTGACGLTAISNAVDPSNGNEYAAYEDFACGPHNNLVIAYTSAGTRQWTVEDLDHDDIPAQVAVDSTSHTVIVASTRNGNEMLTQAFDPANGHVRWQKGFAATGGAGFLTSGVVIDAHGHAVVTGTVTRSGVPEFSTRAFSVSTGTLLWSSHYDGGDALGATAAGIAVDPGQNRAYVVGKSFTGDGEDLVTVAYNTANGHTAWTAEDTGEDAGPVGIAVDSGNHQVYSVNANSNNAEADTYAYSETGALLWRRVYEGSGFLVRAVAVDSVNHQAYLAGFEGANVHATVVAYSPTGTRKWFDTDTSIQQAIPVALAADTANHRVYVTVQVGPSATHTVTFADSATGARAWTETYSLGGGRSSAPGAVSVDASRGQVYVAGYQTGPGNVGNYALTIADKA